MDIEGIYAAIERVGGVRAGYIATVELHLHSVHPLVSTPCAVKLINYALRRGAFSTQTHPKSTTCHIKTTNSSACLTCLSLSYRSFRAMV